MGSGNLEGDIDTLLCSRQCSDHNGLRAGLLPISNTTLLTGQPLMPQFGLAVQQQCGLLPNYFRQSCFYQSYCR